MKVFFPGASPGTWSVIAFLDFPLNVFLPSLLLSVAPTAVKKLFLCPYPRSRFFPHLMLRPVASSNILLGSRTMRELVVTSFAGSPRPQRSPQEMVDSVRILRSPFDNSFSLRFLYQIVPPIPSLWLRAPRGSHTATTLPYKEVIM